MLVTAIKTHKLTPSDTSITVLLDQYLPQNLKERSIVVVTSKIVGICEGNVVPITGDEGLNGAEIEAKHKKEKDDLVAKEADFYIPSDLNPYDVSITIKNSVVVASAGIDESNGNGYYILWPKDPQKSANAIRSHIAKSKGLKEVGVILTDSTLTPLRWGVTGVGIAHSGFEAVNDLIGKPDIFGRPMHVTKVNILDGLSAAAVFVIGESNEQTPLAVIEDIPHVVFQDHNPTSEELALLTITMEEDVFGPILKKAPWKKGGR